MRLEAVAPEPGLARALVTPEGVALPIALGSTGDRIGAFLTDLLIIAAALVVLTIVAGLAAWAIGAKSGEVIVIIWLAGFFVLRCFYFTLFELGPRAATPGKRFMRLRVVARNGGRLGAESILVRNALREIEVFLPLTLLAASGAVGEPVDAVIVLLALAWTGIFLFFPLFNRDRLRPGDLVAGSWVVRIPRPTLLRDLATPSGHDAVRFAFTPEQVDAYGVKELHLLEGVLRRMDRRTLSLVAERIRGRIGWIPAPDEGEVDFLTAYYAALRGRLEQRLLFGRRRRDKFDVG
ncbi:MAG TPA: RDD family protein [Caulobacteraceae bacterium]